MLNIWKIISPPEMTDNMKTIHIEKQSYDGYCVGTGIEYPEIIVWVENKKALHTVQMVSRSFIISYS